MLISHTHRFVFIRCRKTASTSTEIHLSRWLGAEDVITSFCARDEELRRTAGGLPPQNTANAPTPFFNHMAASEIRDAAPDAWNSYFKFCFERNPWDKVISLYFHRHKTVPRISFDEFLESGEALDARNSRLYTIDGAVAVDRIGRYETLVQDLSEICLQIGIPAPAKLETAKGQFRVDRRPYREFLTPAQRAYIDRAFADEIEMHGYQY